MNHRQKAKDLVNLAIDARTPEKERAVAMVALVKLIHEHDLLSSPLDGLLNTDNRTIRAAATIFERVTDPGFVDSVREVARGLTPRRPGAGGRAAGPRRR
jgi:hypothetical protein